MNKKVYQVPSMAVKNLLMQSLLQVSQTGGNGELNPVVGPGNGSGSSTPRSRQFSVWDEDEDWDN